MATHYRHDYEAFGRLVVNSPMMQAAMRARAEKVQELFIATAPVSDEPDDEHRSRYKDSSRVESGVGLVVELGARAYGRVVVDDPDAMSIEYGHTAPDGSHVDGSFTLTRALDGAGD